MIRQILELFRGPSRAPALKQRQKRFFEDGPDYVYAIGDIHGCNDQLEQLEARIEEDAQALEGSKWLIMLGDYVDRGPKSATVIDRLMARSKSGLIRHCLAGNHEDIMLEFLDDPAPDHRWLNFGGIETLRSYGIVNIPPKKQALRYVLQSHMPEEHITFLRDLPSLISIPGFCFVHAGIDRSLPLADQDDAILLWQRPDDSEDDVATSGPVVVHGHTPVAAVDVRTHRINVDTGAYMSGKLSAVRLSRNAPPHIIQCGS